MKIDKEFVLKTDLTKLRDLIFVEDSEGNRYRERIIEEIEKIGVENWFKARGLPTDDNSVWKNRYTGDEITLKEDIHQFDNGHLECSINTRGYYLWENWLPIEMWDNKNMDKGNLKRWF